MHKNATSHIEYILEATPHEVATVGHLPHISKTIQIRDTTGEVIMNSSDQPEVLNDKVEWQSWEKVTEIRASSTTRCWWWWHTHTHTHTHIYIYIYTCVFVEKYRGGLYFVLWLTCWTLNHSKPVKTPVSPYSSLSDLYPGGKYWPPCSLAYWLNRATPFLL